MSRIVITGASGFIGQNLVRRLAQHDLWCLSRVTPEESIPGNWLRHDLMTNPIPDGLPDDVDIVIHLAQSKHFKEFPDRAREIFAVNVASTATLADWAQRAGAKTFIYISTGGIYYPSDTPLREEIQFRAHGQLGFYQTSKYASELLLSAYNECFTSVILRPFFVYGPGQNQDMLIPSLIGKVTRRDPVTLHAPDGIKINPIYVDDVTAVIEASMSLEHSTTTNVAGHQVLTLRKITEVIANTYGIEAVFEVDEDTPPPHLVADISAATRLFGENKVTFDEGLRRIFSSRR